MYCAAASSPGLPSCSNSNRSNSKSASPGHTSERQGQGWGAADLAARNVNGEAAEVLEHASLGEVPPRRVGGEGRDVAHVDDAVGEERHGGVERGQREQHARRVPEANRASRGGGGPPARRRAGGHRTGGGAADRPRRRRWLSSQASEDSERRGGGTLS